MDIDTCLCVSESPFVEEEFKPSSPISGPKGSDVSKMPSSLVARMCEVFNLTC